jgi:hypothetical protein
MDGRFEFNPADLGSHITGAALMLDHKVHTLHHNPVLVLIPSNFSAVAVDFVTMDHALDRSAQRAAFAPGIRSISACDNFDRVPSLDSFH